MSTDNTNREQSRDDDVRVSAVYRETATASTPEHLDRLVLRRAAMAARPPLGRMRSWTRPLAWAATIALSVAIVLEVARSPAPDGVPVAPAPEIKRIEQHGTAQSGTADAARRAVAADRATASPAPDAPPSRQRKNESLEEAPTAAADAGGASLQGPPAAEQDMDFREATASRPAATMKLVLPSATGVREEAAEPAACDSDARSTAESWLACIVELENSGQTAAANRERELLVGAFPEFLAH